MKRIVRVAVLAICVVLAALTSVAYMWFHGYFDPGRFEIKQAQWSSSKQVATLAERSDQEALGGLTYFVVIGNHVPSSVELRHAYHSNTVVFAATSTCLTVRWESPGRLVIVCKGSYLDQQDIDVEKRKYRGVDISYVNISPNTAETFRPK